MTSTTGTTIDTPLLRPAASAALVEPLAMRLIVLSSKVIVAIAGGIAAHVELGFNPPAASIAGTALFLAFVTPSMLRPRVPAEPASMRTMVGPAKRRKSAKSPADVEVDFSKPLEFDGAAGARATDATAEPAQPIAAASQAVPATTPSVRMEFQLPEPAVSPAAPPAGVDEFEVARVERLVKRLADEVGGRAAIPRPSAAAVAPAPSLGGDVSDRMSPPVLGPLTLPFVEPPALNPRLAAAEKTIAALRTALASGSIDVTLDPILSIEGRRAEHYEVAIQMKDLSGAEIDLARAGAGLDATGLLPLVDQTRIAKAVRLARKLAERGKSPSIFAALDGGTLDDKGFQAQFAEPDSSAGGAFPQQLVLTLDQNDVRHLTEADWLTLARLRSAGFGFAVSKVADLDMDFEALATLGFRFARLEATVFLNGLPVAGTVVPPQDICQHLAQSGLTVIVAALSTEEELAQVAACGAVLGQGRLFGLPRPVKPEVLS